MPFNNYAAYYDLLYRDKDYKKEVEFILSLINQHLPSAKNLLDVGCGTGHHARLFKEAGFDVTAIDRSVQMIELAKKASMQGVKFKVEDIDSFVIEESFDVVVSLFDVMSYQVSNAQFQAAFANISKHLSPGGLFIFDCWYGPGVLADPPATVTKSIENDQLRLTRNAFPSINKEANSVNVKYEIEVTEAGGNTFSFEENHLMRYFFLPELKSIFERYNFTCLAKLQWFKKEEVTTEACWKILFVLQKH